MIYRVVNRVNGLVFLAEHIAETADLLDVSCVQTGNRMVLAATAEQLQAWEHGAYVQVALPNATPVQREFLITGMSEQEQNDLYSQFEE